MNEINYLRKQMKRPLNVIIQYCINCQEHNWFLRHESHKYFQRAEEIRQNILKLTQNINVTFNEPPEFLQKHRSIIIQQGREKYLNVKTKKTIIFPRIGSFQIYVNNILVSSKISSKKWPNPTEIIQKIQQIQKDQNLGIDLSKYQIIIEQKKEQINKNSYLGRPLNKMFKIRSSKCPRNKSTSHDRVIQQFHLTQTLSVNKKSRPHSTLFKDTHNNQEHNLQRLKSKGPIRKRFTKQYQNIYLELLLPKMEISRTNNNELKSETLTFQTQSKSKQRPSLRQKQKTINKQTVLLPLSKESTKLYPQLNIIINEPIKMVQQILVSQSKEQNQQNIKLPQNELQNMFLVNKMNAANNANNIEENQEIHIGNTDSYFLDNVDSKINSQSSVQNMHFQKSYRKSQRKSSFVISEVGKLSLNKDQNFLQDIQNKEQFQVIKFQDFIVEMHQYVMSTSKRPQLKIKTSFVELKNSDAEHESQRHNMDLKKSYVFDEQIKQDKIIEQNEDQLYSPMSPIKKPPLISQNLQAKSPILDVSESYRTENSFDPNFKFRLSKFTIQQISSSKESQSLINIKREKSDDNALLNLINRETNIEEIQEKQIEEDPEEHQQIHLKNETSIQYTQENANKKQSQNQQQNNVSNQNLDHSIVKSQTNKIDDMIIFQFAQLAEFGLRNFYQSNIQNEKNVATPTNLNNNMNIVQKQKKNILSQNGVTMNQQADNNIDDYEIPNDPLADLSDILEEIQRQETQNKLKAQQNL